MSCICCSIQVGLPCSVTCGRAISCGQYGRGKLRGSCGELRLLVYASFAFSCSHVGGQSRLTFNFARKRPGLVRALPRESPLFWTSEENLESKLHHARVTRVEHEPEGRIREISVRIRKLGMVPSVIELRAELGIDFFGDRRALGNPQVGVAQRRAAAERVGHVSERAKIRIGDIAGIEPKPAVRL